MYHFGRVFEILWFEFNVIDIIQSYIFLYYDYFKREGYNNYNCIKKSFNILNGTTIYECILITYLFQFLVYYL